MRFHTIKPNPFAIAEVTATSQLLIIKRTN